MTTPRPQVQVSFVPDEQPQPPLAAPQQLRPGIRAALPALLLVALVAAVYGMSIRFGFIHTDRHNITENLPLQSRRGLKAIWLNPGATPHYSPVAYTAMLMENRLGRGRASAFHAGSIALHALNTVWLWILLKKLAVRGAFFAAALFAAHPIQLEAVAWVSQQRMLLCSAAYLLGLWMYLKSAGVIITHVDDTEPPRTPVAPWVLYAISVALIVAAMLCHPIGATFPVVAGLLVHWHRGRLGADQIKRLIPLLGIGILVIILACVAHARVHRFEAPVSLGTSVAASLRTMITYPLRVVFPIAVPSFAAAEPPDGWLADHSLYLLFAAIAAAVAALASRFVNRVAPAKRWLIPAGGALLVGIFAGVTFARLPVFRDDTSLWTWVYQRNPDSVAALNALAMIELHQGKSPQKAIAHLTRALANNPRDPRTLLNLAAVHMEEGEIDKAIMRYHQVLSNNADHAEAHFNLAVALARLGRQRDAVQQMQQALRLRPSDVKIHLELGSLYTDLGDYRQALNHYDQAMKLDPRNPAACFEAARLLCNHLGEWQRAIALLERARQLDPTNVNIVMFAGALQFDIFRGRAEQKTATREELRHGFHTAELMFRQAILMKPDLALAYLNLGKCLGARSQHAADTQERFDCLNEAVVCFERASILDPHDTEAPALRSAAQRQRDEAGRRIR